jgi:hypothetical protein
MRSGRSSDSSASDSDDDDDITRYNETMSDFVLPVIDQVVEHVWMLDLFMHRWKMNQLHNVNDLKFRKFCKLRMHNK